MGASEVRGVSPDLKGRTWRHPSEVGAARRSKSRNRRELLSLIVWTILLLIISFLGYNIVTD